MSARFRLAFTGGVASLFGQDPSWTKAEELYRQTEYQESLALLLQIRATRRAAILPWLDRDYFMLGDYKKATEAFEKACGAGTRESRIRALAGPRVSDAGPRLRSPFLAPMYASKARQYFEKAVALDPNNGEALNDLFDYYLEAPGFLGGGYDKAEAVAKRIARTIQPKGTSRRRKWPTSANSSIPPRSSFGAPWSWHRGRWAGCSTWRDIWPSAGGFKKAKRRSKGRAAGAQCSQRCSFARAGIYVQQKRNLDQAQGVAAASTCKAI